MLQFTNRLAVLVLLSATASSSFANTLTVNFSNIESSSGKIMVAVYDSEETYKNRGKPAYRQTAKVSGDTVIVQINDVFNGEYAIKSYVDANDNDALDTNLIGMPKEQYGFSNNAGKYGPPAFSEAMFKVEGDTTTDITMR